MLKLFKRLDKFDWIFLVILVAFVVAQVYFDVTIPGYTAEIVNEMISAGATAQSILSIGLVMLLYALGSMACTIVVYYIASHVGSKLSQRLRRNVFEKVQSFSMEETNKFSTASLITRSTNDIQQVQLAFIMILRLAISAPIMAVWAIIKINNGSGELTIATALWVSLLVVFLAILYFIVVPKFKSLQKMTDKLNGVTRENLTGLKIVKAYNADSYEQKKFDKVNTDITKLNIFTNRILGSLQPAMLIIMNGLVLTIYWLGASLINTGSINIGTMLAFSSLAMQVLMAFMMLMMLLIIVPRASVSAKRINEVLGSKISIIDTASEDTFISKGEVEFKNVSFKYPGAEDYVLKDINFTVKQGETVAIIGSTGSGKSTILNLIPRFYDASEGEVLVDGVNIKNVKQKTLRNILGYVPQKGVLFTGTVNSNIGYSDNDMPAEKIEEASKVAKAYDFIEEMEKGFDSAIAQGGKNVSGGQKQRISIARAVASDPEIFIFDDSFSALDYKTDKEVRKNLKTKLKTATKIIVAQRIGTILDADKIIVLEQGSMVGYGSHKELIKNCKVYQEIALSQLSPEELGL